MAPDPAFSPDRAGGRLAEQLRAGDRAALARAITLVESRNPQHRGAAETLLAAVAPYGGTAWRVGVTGVPGAGKSTLIEQLGLNLIAAGRAVAVLAIDPSSTATRGSILGDKLRMPRLGQAAGAFIRPSPSAGMLGGAALATREAILLVEAAGYDVVLVETVGVGQSEAAVATMVDTVLLLLVAGAGDDVQGLKRGLLEHADIVAVNKAEGANAPRAEAAAADYRAALHVFARTAGWEPPVLTVSALANVALDTLWRHVGAHREALRSGDGLARKRARQGQQWLREAVEQRLRATVDEGAFAARLAGAEAAVARGVLPSVAARDVVP